MTGEYTQGCSAHLLLAVQVCASVRLGRGYTGAGVGQWGVRRYMYTATLKNQENESVNHTAFYSHSHTLCLWRTAPQAFKVVKCYLALTSLKQTPPQPFKPCYDAFEG
jgi:hypothetical protein